MRAVALLFALALSLASVPADADELVQHTTMRGTPAADLVGRWLAVTWIGLPGEKFRSTSTLWEVTREDGQLKLSNRFAELPAAQADAMAAANQAEKAWRPTPDDLAAITAAWDGLKPSTPHLATVENEIVAHDAFDDSLTREPRSKNALWVVRQTEVFDSSAAPTVKQVNVFGVSGAEDGDWVGNYAGAIIAAAPFPIPIPLSGTFRLYRLWGPAGGSRGFVARVLDLFSGCGRRGE
jgi:hypothetical protein